MDYIQNATAVLSKGVKATQCYDVVVQYALRKSSCGKRKTEIWNADFSETRVCSVFLCFVSFVLCFLFDFEILSSPLVIVTLLPAFVCFPPS